MSKSRDIADSAATINYIDNVTSDVQSQLNTLTTAIDNVSVTSGTLTKTFTTGESSTINLTSSVLAPVVSVTKEVPQSGVTNNSWDVNSTTENYTRLDSAYDTTLNWVGFDISNPSIAGSLSITGQDTVPTGIAFNTDGTKMFIAGHVSQAVNEYNLSTAFDITTASYATNFSVASQEVTPYSIAFNPNGTKMFVIGYGSDQVHEYSLSTGFSVSTASYTQSFSVAAQETSPFCIAFNPDGTKMFVAGEAGDDVNEYTLSTGFDISTASFVDSFSISAQVSSPVSVEFNNDGTQMFVIDYISDNIYQYNLTTAYDVSTASYSSISFSVASQTLNPLGLFFNTAGSKFFVTAQGGTVYQYTMPTALTLGTGSFASADVGKTIEANSGEFVLTAASGSYVETTAPTSYDQVASGDWEMYGVVYNAADGDLELSGATINQFDVSTAVYSQSFSVASQDSSPFGIAFNTDGTKMFVLGLAGDSVYEYTLSTGFDVSTASFVDSFSVSAQDTQPTDISFNTDGTKMFVLGFTGQDVNEYTLSTGFDISTASFVDSFSVSAQETSPYGIAFNANGTKMFIVGVVGDDVNEYTLSTSFDVSTASFVDSFSVASQEQVPLGIAFNTDGTKMFIVGQGSNAVYEYNLSIGFDVSTASFVDSFSVASQETLPFGITFNTDGTKMFIVGNSGDSVYEYSIGTTATPSGYHPVHTTASTDTTYWTDINSMTADQNAGDGNVYYAISTDDRTTWTVIDNTDGERDIVRNNAGTWQYNSNGTYALETWVNGTTNTELATLAEAMEGASNAVGYQLSSASFDSVTFSFASQNTVPRGFAFNSDGTKMYQAAYSGTIYQYTLSTGYDLSTASYSISASFTAQSTSIASFAFSSDGAKLYILSYANDTVYQYSLSTAYDITSASYDSVSFSVSGQESDPYGMTWNSDGTKMYVIGTNGQDVNEYALSTAYDISTASFVDSFSVSSQETAPYAVTFSSDGTSMFVCGNSSDSVHKYTLSTGFDVSTASFTESFSVSGQEATPNGISFNTDGTKMFVSGYGSDNVNQYSTAITSYINQMDKTQLDAVTDPNHIALGNDLDLAIVFNMTSGTTVPSSDGVAINYDANILNQGAVLGTDYNFDAPASDKVRITAVGAGNYKVRVV